MKAKTSSTNFRKLMLKILLCFFLLTSAIIVTFILIGYFAASAPVSYLPEINPNDFKSHPEGSKQIGLKGSRYFVFVRENGVVNVQTIDGKDVMSNLLYYSLYEGSKGKIGLDNVLVKLTSDSTILINGEGQLGVQVSLLLTVPKDKPKLNLSIKTLYNKNTIVRRESLVAAFEVPVSEVYRKNRQVDVESYDSEYWLQQEGVRFGRGNRSAMIYHTPFVSSLQLNTKRNLLFVNLDYYLDHLFFNIPYQENSGGRWVDASTAHYVAGDERNNNFSIYFGDIPKITPRIMLVPKGYLAGYVFTEHADGGTIRTNRAAYFGSEDISNSNEAIGGFVGHKIPTTKSVFYADPDSAAYISIRDDPKYPQFLNFLDQLNKTGQYEICLHTPENLNSSRELLEESIRFMKDRFGTTTWIDHGMYNGKLNRETMVADGLNPNSEFYAADLWEKFDTRYFWSAAVEEIRKYSLKDKIIKLKFYDASVNLWRLYLAPKEMEEMKFYTALRVLVRRYRDKGELNSLRPNKGNAFPTPLYWQHLTRTRRFYSWATDYFKKYSNLSDKKVEVEQKLLNKLVIDWGVFINHGYFVRNIKDVDVLSESNGKIIINPYFDKILGNMAHLRDEGDLYITTIRDLLDYWVMTENLSFDYQENGDIYVYNNNDKPISGLSLVIHGSNVQVNGEIPKFKRVGYDTIFWFDIQARSQVILKFTSL